jgi:hypothetical protein
MRFLAALMLLCTILPTPAFPRAEERIGDWRATLDVLPFAPERTMMATAGTMSGSMRGDQLILSCSAGARLRGLIILFSSPNSFPGRSYKVRARADRNPIFDLDANARSQSLMSFVPTGAFLRSMAEKQHLHVQVIEDGAVKLTLSFRINGAEKIVDALAEACPAHFAQ